MPKFTIDLPDPLDARLLERVKSSGARSTEEYLLGLVKSDCDVAELERLLKDRMEGSFAELEPDWQERVRSEAARRSKG